MKGIFDTSRLKTYLNYKQNGNIWRMYFTNNDLLVCETRDLEKKEVYYFSLNYKTNKFFLKNFQITEKWWVSIQSVNRNSIFFSYFRKPDLPEHLGFTTIDIITGEEKWTNKDLIFLFATDKVVFAFKQLFETKVYYKLEPTNGKIIEEIRDETEISSILQQKSDHEKISYADCIYPAIYSVDLYSEEDVIKNYIKDRIKQLKLEGSLELIKFHDYLIYNFHKNNGVDLKNLNARDLTNVLEIYDMTSDRLVYDDILNISTPNYVPDSFFIKDNILFYVKEKRNLITLKLN